MRGMALVAGSVVLVALCNNCLEVVVRDNHVGETVVLLRQRSEDLKSLK